MFISSSITLDPQCLYFESWNITSGLNQKSTLASLDTSHRNKEHKYPNLDLPLN